MTSTRRWAALVLLSVLGVAAARADLESSKFVGNWQGTMTICIDGQCEASSMSLTFCADGIALLKNGDTETEEAPYRIEKDVVILDGPPETPDIRLTKIEFGTTTLVAFLEPMTAEAMPEGTFIRLDLTRLP